MGGEAGFGGAGVPESADLVGFLKLCSSLGEGLVGLADLVVAQPGMTLVDVSEVPMDPSTVVTASSSHQVDAGLWYQLITRMKKGVPDLV